MKKLREFLIMAFVAKTKHGAFTAVCSGKGLLELPFRPVFFAIAVAAALTACSTTPLQMDEPYAITKEKVALLKAENATKEDVTKLFGEPEMVTPTKKGEAYFYKGLNLNSLWVTFKSDGTVDKLKWSE